MVSKKKTQTKNKIFVLDTSTLIYNPESLFKFGSRTVVVPLTVLDELDRFKGLENENGRNARTVIRTLNELRQRGNLKEGLTINDEGGVLRIGTYTSENVPNELLYSNADNKILGICKSLAGEGNVVLITKDINLAVKADCLGIEAEDFVEDNLIKKAEELYSGFAEVEVEDSFIDELYESKTVRVMLNTFPNQFLLFRSLSNKKKTAMGRVLDCSGNVKLVKKNPVWGLEPRNLQQIFAVDILLDDSVNLVTLSGLSGSGKSLLSIAAGLQKVIEERKYDSFIISRPTISLGKQDIGFLPGGIDEKMEPWLRPIRDSVEVLFGKKGAGGQYYEEMVERGVIKIEPLAYIRGRSFHNSFILVDEIQNLSRHEMKAFLTRAGDNTKVVLTGDILQIDSPSLDSVNNGLSQVIEKFKPEQMSGHVSLIKGERSKLATAAAHLL